MARLDGQEELLQHGPRSGGRSRDKATDWAYCPPVNETTGKATKPAPFDQVWLRNDLTALIDSLSIAEKRKHFLRSRWLETLLWMESAAQRTRRRYYTLRLMTVVGAVIVPALVSIGTP